MAGLTLRTREKTMWKDEKVVDRKKAMFRKDVDVFIFRGKEPLVGEVVRNQALSYLQHEYNRFSPELKKQLLQSYSIND